MNKWIEKRDYLQILLNKNIQQINGLKERFN